MTSVGAARVVQWPVDVVRSRAAQVLDVYAEAMQVPAEAARAREGVLLGHLEREGFRAMAAVDHEERLVGVAYGYLGAPGQWWHDQVRAALTPRAAREWLEGSFEVCELHVRPGQQGQGLGRALLDALLTDQPARTAVLTTPDAETRARGFYRVAGWVELVRRLRFPGDPRVFAVLALPLEQAAGPAGP